MLGMLVIYHHTFINIFESIEMHTIHLSLEQISIDSALDVKVEV